MTTFKLFWGTIWRSAAYGFLFGTFGGSSFGALFANAMLLFALFTQTDAPFTPADAGRGIFAILFFALIGAGIGSLFGTPTGIFLGITGGVLFGVVTRAFFYPLKDARWHRRIVGTLCAAYAAVGAWICFALILRFYAKDNVVQLPLVAIVATAPAIVAGACGWFISQRVARWYERAEKK
jgi:hypothetical protein